MSSMLRTAICTAVLAFSAAACNAQAAAPADPVDVAFTFNAQRTLRVSTGQNFWLEGGSAELGIGLGHGFGIAFDYTGTRTSSIGTSGVPLVLGTATVGPRYRMYAARRWSPYVQALIGEATGMDSTFATPTGAVSNASSFAFQANGGLDCRSSQHIAFRVLDVGYLHAGLGNGGSNTQNLLRLGAGVVIRFKP
nr:outer membrane beta-barrel protein [Granulicella paludicola]